MGSLTSLRETQFGGVGGAQSCASECSRAMIVTFALFQLITNTIG